jgi:hypothetical protein
MSGKTVKQHYVPQFYLRYWCDTQNTFIPIKIVDRDTGTIVILKRAGTSVFCFENYFYAKWTGKEDEFSQIVEKTFIELESFFSKELPKVEKKIVEYYQISDSEKYLISQFAIMMWLRGKSYREWSNEVTDSMVRKMSQLFSHKIGETKESRELLKKYNLTKEEMIEFVKSGQYKVEVSNTHHLKMFESMEEFCNLLYAKYWKVLISKKGEFITTDTPYLDLPRHRKEPSIYGQSFLEREQYLILSPRVTIVAVYPKNETGKKFKREDVTNNKNLIAFINAHHLMNSIRFGFHNKREVIQETKDMVSILEANKEEFSKHFN